MLVLATLWFFLLFDPHWWLNARGVSVLLRVPIILFGALSLTLLFDLLTVKEVGRRWRWAFPVLMLTVVMYLTVPATINSGLAVEVAKTWLLYWIFIVSTATLIHSARRAEKLVLIYGLQFVFWTAYGTMSGLVAWHPTLANYDTYGAWTAMGVGYCVFLAGATDRKTLRNLLYLLAGLCAVGVVSSQARGAFLAALAVAGVTFYRSPNKGRAVLGAVVGVVIFMVAASVLHGPEYWIEMATILDGTEDATGEDRWEMWKAAIGVWATHPFFGVGADNWGIFAASYYQPGELGGPFVDNPGRLYGISAHNAYITILAENGLFGISAFIWIFIDFWRRNLSMRSEEAAAKWAAIGGRLKLTSVALGLEAAMIGYVVSASLYSVLGVHWLWTVVAINLLLHNVVTHAPPVGRLPAGARPRRSRPRMPLPGPTPGPAPAGVQRSYVPPT